MENKNLIVAIVLSLLVMVGWTFFAQHFGLIPDQQQVAEQQAAIQQANEQEQKTSEETIKLATQAPVNSAPGRDVIVETPLYKAVIYSGGATLRSFELKKYPSEKQTEPWITVFGFPLGEVVPKDGLKKVAPVNLVHPNTSTHGPLGLLINGQASWSTGTWSFNGQDVKLDEGKTTLEFIGQVDGLDIVRKLTFYADTYQIDETVDIVNPNEQARTARIAYTVAENTQNASGGYYDAMRVGWDMAGDYNEETDIETLTTTGAHAQGNIYWGAAMSAYFMSAIAPTNTANVILAAQFQGDVYRVILGQGDVVVQPNSEASQSVTYWFGPKLRSLLEKAPNNLVSSIDLGMFGLIGGALLWCLELFYSYVHNWGIAIVLLTIAIKAVFWPLTAKTYKSMAKMRKLQPMMTAIREKYPDDPAARNQEMMNLYKTYKINPAGGCVPMLIQLPVLFGLLQALPSSVELRGASFITYFPGTDIIWLADLSAPDPLYITPLLTGLTMFLMQKLSPPMGDPIQQKIMLYLPLVFMVLFFNFPSGLTLYWTISNILSIAQQWHLLRSNDKA